MKQRSSESETLLYERIKKYRGSKYQPASSNEYGQNELEYVHVNIQEFARKHLNETQPKDDNLELLGLGNIFLA